MPWAYVQAFFEQHFIWCVGTSPQAKQGEDVHRCGLVLEWVFGSIVSTAEKVSYWN